MEIAHSNGLNRVHEGNSDRQGALLPGAVAELSEDACSTRPHLAVLHQHRRVRRPTTDTQDLPPKEIIISNKKLSLGTKIIFKFNKVSEHGHSLFRYQKTKLKFSDERIAKYSRLIRVRNVCISL